MIQTITIHNKPIHIDLSKLRQEIRDIYERILASKAILRAPHENANQQQRLHTIKLRPTATFLYALRAHLRGRIHGKWTKEHQEEIIVLWLKMAGPYRQDFTHLIVSDEEAEKERAQREEETRKYQESLEEIRSKGTSTSTGEDSIQAVCAYQAAG